MLNLRTFAASLLTATVAFSSVSARASEPLEPQAASATADTAQFTLGDQPSAKGMAGTVLAVHRYRAEQPSARDVQVVAPSNPGGTTQADSGNNTVAQADKASQGNGFVQGPSCANNCGARASNSAAQADKAAQGNGFVQGPRCSNGGCISTLNNTAAQADKAAQGNGFVQGPGCPSCGARASNSAAQADKAAQGNGFVQGPSCTGNNCGARASNSAAQADKAAQGNGFVQGPSCGGNNCGARASNSAAQSNTPALLGSDN